MVSIASEKVTEILSVIETPLWLSVGEVEETVGAEVSVVEEPVVLEDVLSVDAEEPPSSLPHEIMVRLKRKRERIMSICFTWFPIVV